MNTKRTESKLGDRFSTSQTDWDRVDKLTDDDIDCSDIPELDEEFFKNARVVTPPGKEQIALRVDKDVLEWMKAQGKGYQSRINAILRAYYEAHRGRENVTED